MSAVSPPLQVRPAGPEDGFKLFSLSQEFVANGLLRHRPLADFEEQLGDFLTVSDGDRLIGCLAVRRLAGAPGAAVLYNFCVLPEYHGRGTGSALLAEATARWAERGVRSLYTATVRRDNWFWQRRFRRVTASEAPAAWLEQLDPARNSLLFVRELRAGVTASPQADGWATETKEWAL
ncbi:GNAT family N-acetyltransferase [Streptomyces sp. B-S-A8]|uniref:GNAT family N-acetyltransferase n=1 Tax=Streptomyces solicavernae TaxID=3043614 RepID=A0ABT6RY42_9ACTN|nr:GNAT family N-acetyltransferase [Streptomyces sp. B-S-A8]MDI3389357.1 GNAT family N-acetyltransferase [Streptomyces sp. B-S-A8]